MIIRSSRLSFLFQKFDYKNGIANRVIYRNCHSFSTHSLINPKAIGCKLLVKGTFKPFTRFTSSLSSPLLTKLVKSCSSCGIKLQNVDRQKPGFYIDKSTRQESKPFKKYEDDVFEKHLKQLSVEDQKLLTNENVELLDTMNKYPKRQSLGNRLDLPESSECIRCRDANFRLKFAKLTQEFPMESLDDIMTNIPLNANLVYVINAQDFPMSINPEIFKFKSAQSIKFILTKSDLLFETNSLSLKYGLTFVQDYLYSKYNVPRENVFVTSGKTNWNMKDLLNFIDHDSYIIGHVNSGKSSLIKSLMFQLQKHKLLKPRKLSKRDLIKQQKQQDKQINQQSTTVESASNRRKEKRAEELIKQRLGPGVSHVPGFTRGFIEIVLGDEFDTNAKTIYDVPGFASIGNNHEMCNLVDDISNLRTLSKGVKVFEHGYYYSKYKTIKGNQCLTFGGLNLLIPPANSIYQIRSCINFPYEIFKNLETASKLCTNLNDFPSLTNKFLTHYDDKSFSSLRRFIIPPHYGAIDVVFQNIGHINLTPTGAKNNNQPMVLYLPAGVNAIVRQPITNYISKSFTGKDVNRNPLKKENYLEKSTFALRHYNNKEPYYSRLIPSDKCEDELSQLESDYRAISKWVSMAKGSTIEYNENTVIDESNKYKFWIE